MLTNMVQNYPGGPGLSNQCKNVACVLVMDLRSQTDSIGQDLPSGNQAVDFPWFPAILPREPKQETPTCV